MSLLKKILPNTSVNKKIVDNILCERGNIDSFFPSDFSETEKINIESVKPFTMTSLERLVALSRAVDYIAKNNIEGDIVECGVWRGGSMMMIGKKLMQLNDDARKLFLFDTYEGMSAPGDEDVSAIDNTDAKKLLDESDKMQGNNVWCYSSLEDVKSNLKKTNYDAGKLFFIKGKVEDTLPHPAINKIALLRLDTDWYESTRHELEILFDKIVTGGVLIIDDYGHWSGSKKAVDEFIEKRKLTIFLNRIDYTGRLAIKI